MVSGQTEVLDFHVTDPFVFLFEIGGAALGVEDADVGTVVLCGDVFGEKSGGGK